MTHDIVDDCWCAGIVRATSWGAVVLARGRAGELVMVGYISDPPRRAYRRALRDMQPSPRRQRHGDVTTGLDYRNGDLTGRQNVVISAAACLVFFPALYFGVSFFWSCIALLIASLIGLGAWDLLGERDKKMVTIVEAESGSALEALLDGCRHNIRSAPLAEQAALCLLRRAAHEPVGFYDLVAELLQACELGEQLSKDSRDDSYDVLLEVAQNLPATDGAVVTVRAGVTQMVTSMRRAIAADERVRTAVDAPVIDDALQQQHDDDEVELSRAVALADRLRGVSDRVGMEAGTSESVAMEFRARDNLTVLPPLA